MSWMMQTREYSLCASDMEHTRRTVTARNVRDAVAKYGKLHYPYTHMVVTVVSTGEKLIVNGITIYKKLPYGEKDNGY